MDCVKLGIRQLVHETVDWFVTVRFEGHNTCVAEDISLGILHRIDW
jgi:hypothetical protein